MKDIPYRISILAIIIIFGTTFGMSAQDNDETMEKLETYSEMQYVKLSDGNKQFVVDLTFDGEEDTEPVRNAAVQFFTGFDELAMIAETTTDDKGKAKLRIENDYALPLNEEGYFFIKAVFDGNEKFEASESEVEYIDATLTIRMDTADGEKNILVSLSRFNMEGEKEAISDEDIFIYVPRMFNQLQIGDGYLEEGEAIIEFPKDLPGDTEGLITLIAKLEDHSDYGNIEIKTTGKWGTEKLNDFTGEDPALWTAIAPMWMIVTLIILLAGVWGHYVWAVLQLFRIKKNV